MDSEEATNVETNLARGGNGHIYVVSSTLVLDNLKVRSPLAVINVSRPLSVGNSIP